MQQRPTGEYPFLGMLTGLVTLFLGSSSLGIELLVGWFGT